MTIETFAADWEAERARGIARLVATEPGVVWSEGHKLLTLGAHTGHTVRAIAFCENEAWAAAIASALSARTTPDNGEVGQ